MVPSLKKLRHAPIARMLIIITLVFVVSYLIISNIAHRLQGKTQTIEIGILGYPYLINPLWSRNNPVDQSIVPLIYRGLITFDESGNPLGDLAQDWEIAEDGRTITVFLKPNQYWQDGEPITAEDIVFTYQLTQSKEYNGPEKNRFKDIEVTILGDDTIQLVLPENFSPFLEALTLGILPKHIWEAINLFQLEEVPYNLKPIGSTNLAITKVITDNQGVRQITLTQQQPMQNHYQRVNLHFYPHQQAAINAFKLGEIDVLFSIDPEINQVFTDWPNITMSPTSICGQTISLLFNLENESSPVNDKTFRKSLAQLLITENPTINRIRNIIPDSHWAFSPQTFNLPTPESATNTIEDIGNGTNRPLLYPIHR